VTTPPATPPALPPTTPTPRALPSVLLRGIPAQARQVQGQRAGLVTRVAANAVDVAVVAVGLLVAYLGWLGVLFAADPSRRQWPHPSSVLLGGLGSWVLGVYFMVCWAVSGRTVGDHLVGLKVVGRSGRRVGWVTAAARAAFCVLFPVGLAWAAVSSANRSVQDVVLRTSVVYAWVPGRAATRPPPRRREPGAVVPPTAG